MRIRTVSREWEARLEPVPSSPFQKAKGKAEWKIYADGFRKCKLSVFNLDLADRTPIEIHINNRLIAQVPLEKGSIRFQRDTEKGEEVPDVAVNDLIQVSNAGRIFLEGRFYAE